MSRRSGAWVLVLSLLAWTPGAWGQESVDGRVSLNDGARITNTSTVQVKVLLKDPPPAGLEMSVFADPSAAGAWRPFVDSQPLALPPGDGEKTVLVKLRDAAGKECALLRASIVVDTTPPVAKVRVPERVAANAATLTSDVTEAVAMQWTEDVTRWGPWLPYLQPRDIALSPGNGIKTLLVRYRDEAGNVGQAAVVRVEVKADPASPPPILRHVLVTAESSSGDRFLAVKLWNSLLGYSEMSVRIDRDEPMPREPFADQKLVHVPRTGGAHRIRLTFFGAQGAEFPVEVAFQEADVLQSVPQGAQETTSSRQWSVSLQAGVLPSAVDFQTMTPTGVRAIKSDAISVGRLSLSDDLLDPFYGQAAVEVASGGAIRILSGSIDLGLSVLRAGGLEVAVEAGLLFSHLQVTASDFGSFDSSLGFRAGLRATVDFSEQWGLDATVDYRRNTYDYSGTILSGDRQARLQTVGLLVGVFLRF